MQTDATDGTVRATAWLSSLALAAVCLLFASRPVHHDIFHQMALVRESLRQGRLLDHDVFSYTAPVRPMIDHEWGAGAIAFAVTEWAGAPGIFLLNAALFAGLMLISARRLRSAKVPLVFVVPALLLLAAVAAYLYTPVCAQAYSLAIYAGLLSLLARDAGGSRRWIPLWLGLFVLWANLHGGIAVAFVTVAAYAVEQAWRGKPWRHLGLVLAAMALLLSVNPYGWRYYGYLLRALVMSRPQIAEWDPRWLIADVSPTTVGFFLCLGLAAYVIAARRLRGVEGVAVLILLGAASIRVMKLAPFFAIAWVFVVPAAFGRTRLGRALERAFLRWSTAAGMASLAVVVLAGALFVTKRPWELAVASQYPVGPVEYLSAAHFRGNVMTYFSQGAYVSWKLYPNVKVSCDGRYEVAYSNELVNDNFRFYWTDVEGAYQRVLAAWPTDLILVGRKFPLARKLESQRAWRPVYLDDGFSLYARPGLELPRVDRRGQAIVGRFP